MRAWALIGLPGVALAISMLPALASAESYLPWQKESGGGRAYVEPGEPYDPSRHGGARVSQYDDGYDALRNNRGADSRPYDPQPSQEAPGQKPYQQRYDPPRSQQQPQYQRQPDYQEQPRYQERPRQTYEQPADRGHRDGYGEERRYDDRSRYNDDRYDRNPQRNSPRYQPPVQGGPGQTYAPPGKYRGDDRARDPRYDRPLGPPNEPETYSDNEILDAGHRFFGKTTKGLAKIVNKLFKSEGRPTAFILGEEGGGALIAGLRYGEGTMYTKSGRRVKVYWQGPSIGYDFGANGSKSMVLIYHLRDVRQIYNRFGGVEGSAYLVGGVGVNLQKRDEIILAPIRTGLGVRFGASIGYLKYTSEPTWNPF